MQWYIGVLKQYANFSGRSRRKEFWMFTLFSFLISVVLAILDGLLGTRPSSSYGTGLLGFLYGLAVLLPTLGVTVRRLHDTNRSGFWVLIGLIPIVGWIVLIVFCALPGNTGPNSHGADPKAGGAGGPVYNTGAAPA
jgi:uncharacterized membrane protein YhaH (DUF805 family)